MTQSNEPTPDSSDELDGQTCIQVEDDDPESYAVPLDQPEE